VALWRQQERRGKRQRHGEKAKENKTNFFSRREKKVEEKRSGFAQLKELSLRQFGRKQVNIDRGGNEHEQSRRARRRGAPSLAALTSPPLFAAPDTRL
jgi:hypothetical protein